MNDLLQELSSTSDSDSSGAESAGEEKEKKDDHVDEADQAERAKLPQYVTRFKVGVCCLPTEFMYISNMVNM